jgi:hypothetical protein
MAGVSETPTVQEGTWLGASPAGTKPGDLVTTLGACAHEIKMNLRDLLGKRKRSTRDVLSSSQSWRDKIRIQGFCG